MHACVCVCVAKPVAVELRCHATALIKTFGMSSKLRVCSNYLIFQAWVLFLKQTNISDVFKIVSRGVDKR